jgi:hypothetical protein
MFSESAFTDGLRYFLMSIAGGVIWPMTFRFWSGLGRSRTKENANIPLT